MTVSFESRVPYAFDEKWVSLTSVLDPARFQARQPVQTTKCAKLSARTFQSAEERKVGDLQRLGAVHEVRDIELTRVVADNDVRVDFFDERAPFREQLLLAGELEHLRPDDVCARVEREDVADERFAVACRDRGEATGLARSGHTFDTSS